VTVFDWDARENPEVTRNLLWRDSGSYVSEAVCVLGSRVFRPQGH